MLKTLSFFCTEGGSDKEYHLSIVEKGQNLFVINASYGRRGGSLTALSKPANPVDLESIKKLFDKLVKERISKGYKPALDNASSTAAAATVTDSKVDSGLRLQLLNPVENEQAALALLQDDSFFAQQKFDGLRKAVIKHKRNITFVNKTGFQCSGKIAFAQALADLDSEDFILDGEDLGNKLIIFDILSIGGTDLRDLPANKRYLILKGFFGRDDISGLEFLQLAPASFTTEDKRRLFHSTKESNYEGVVFKRCSSPYTPGRPASGGDQLKYKFIESASFIVTAVNSKRSVQVSLYTKEGKLEPAGNVTIPVNKSIPEISAVIECQYLYANKPSNVIFQPVYLGIREDVLMDECTQDQLKFKNTGN